LSSERSSAGAGLRAAAARLDLRVVRDRAPLEAVLGEAAGFDARDSGTLRALVSGAVRWHHRLEWQRAQMLDRPLRPRDALLGALLRVGLFQLQGLRVPDHAAVSATVAAADTLGLSRAKGLVNAVLRRFLREREALDARMERMPEALFSHPLWLLARLQHDWPEAWRSVVAANNALPPMWLRVNRLRTNCADYLQRLAAAGISAEPSAELPEAVLLAEPLPVTELPGFADGLVSVQDAAAQLAATLLQLTPGMRVLDACAAPGGKTAHILERCPDLDVLVALDRAPTRLETLRANLDRLGLAAQVVAGDATAPEAWWDGRPFDRILIDAPCSASGVIRRHPDIKLLREEADIGTAVDTQRQMLERLSPLLKPGGRIVYSTCSVLHVENREQIGQFLEGAGRRNTAGARCAFERQVLPGEANMDGFYYACLDWPHSL
jgi:16S rRNA (cytosine967-C5)-methyltransferase